MQKYFKWFVVLFLFLVVYGIYSISTRSSKQPGLESKLTEEKILTFLFSGYDEKEEYSFGLFVFLHPTQKKCGLFFINPIASFDNGESTLQEKKKSVTKYLTPKLESLTGLKVNYTLEINSKQFKSIIDFLSGVNHFEEWVNPKLKTNSFSFKRASGDQIIFGEEALELVSKLDNTQENYLHRLYNQQSLFLNLYDKISSPEFEFKKEYIYLGPKFFDSELKEQDYFALIQYLKKNQLIISSGEIPGEFQYDEKTKKGKLIIKEDIANLAFTKLTSFLSSGDYLYGELSRVEILNNTETSGLAKSAKSILAEKNFKVLSTGNGESSNLKKSIVLDRSGNAEYSYRIAKILGIKSTRHSINNELGLDATVMLGEDFEIKKAK
ncbi:MAG: LCP family protein [Leptospiraceae bacterium]|nr:LCP family protein [Leptospiraceae bacterium]